MLILTTTPDWFLYNLETQQKLAMILCRLTLSRATKKTWHGCENERENQGKVLRRLAILSALGCLLNWASPPSHCTWGVLKTLICKPGGVSGFHDFPLQQQCRTYSISRNTFSGVCYDTNETTWLIPCLLFLLFLSKNLSAWVPLPLTLTLWIT